VEDLKDVIKQQGEIMADFQKAQTQHNHVINEKIDGLHRQDTEIVKKLDGLITSAFPNSDIEGHRRYHETMIELLIEKRRLRLAIQEKTVAGLLWAVMVWVGILLFQGAKAKLGLPI
jgi:hypothetical protein